MALVPGDDNDFNLYSGLIAVGLGLFGCLAARYSNSGHGPRPKGDALAYFVHTRLGLGRKSWLAKQLDLGVLFSATIGELFIVWLYIGWLAIRFAYFLERNALHPSTAARVGKAFGELGPPMILMEYLLAQRYTIWGWVAGIPHERLIGYHRIHGWALYSIFFAHMVCMAHAMRLRINGQPVTRQIDSPMTIFGVNPSLGIAAFCMWTVVVGSSFSIFRRSAYGLWYANHFSFFPAIVLTLFHNRPRNLPWLAASAGFFYIDAGIRGYMKFMRKSRVVKAEVLPGEVAKLTIQTGNSMAYEPGQYVWLALPGLKGPEPLPGISFHPYSISSAYEKGDETYTLHIKSMGKGTWSESVVLAAAGGADAFATGCRIGGPAGRFSINPAHFERILLVAGGIGMTPLMSLLTDLVRDASADKAGGARRYPDLKSVTLLWAVQSAECLSWFKDELEAARACAGLSVDLQLHVTRGKEADAEGQPSFKLGRPEVLPSLQGVLHTKGDGPVGVFACGPEAMLEATHDAVADANRAARGDAAKQALLHTEVFLF